MTNLPAMAVCTTCHAIRPVSGTLGPGDGRNHLTLRICGHVVLRVPRV